MSVDGGAPTAAILDRAGLDQLVDVLSGEGYRVVGPTVRDDAIVLSELDSGAQLPAGWGVETAPGYYRLRRRTDAAVFAHSAGAQSWKQFLHPPRRELWSGDGGAYSAPAEEPVRYAFLGVRACDLAAIRTLGGVLGDGAHPDRSFVRRREGLFVVAAGCTEPGGVCFCASMGTGPSPGPGFDLSLTERIDESGHRFLVDVGSRQGARILARVIHRDALDDEVDDARAAVAAAAGRMGRQMPAGDIRALLADSREAERWNEVATRCLTCGNCTMVCPTCFCTTTEDRTDLDDGTTERAQRWASCFELDFSYLHGGSVRVSGASRYRQWITHKLSSWHDQFGTSGCVGCGRCIAWCPTGIDITAEVAALAEERDDRRASAGPRGQR
ncbi:MAG: 4Fe-4S dicluster domain-containing protein [Blastococcus sp.]